jgi:hypothetical protein
MDEPIASEPSEQGSFPPCGGLSIFSPHRSSTEPPSPARESRVLSLPKGAQGEGDEMIQLYWRAW